jgi:hypothetical protein
VRLREDITRRRWPGVMLAQWGVSSVPGFTTSQIPIVVAQSRWGMNLHVVEVRNVNHVVVLCAIYLRTAIYDVTMKVVPFLRLHLPAVLFETVAQR